MGMYGYNVASDAATFEGYPDLQEQAKELEDRSFAIGVAAPAIGAGVGSAIPVIGTGFGAGAGELVSFFYDVNIELEKSKLEEEKMRREEND
ncbi:MAG: hypothetical protein SOY70_03090 [Veillonellaceae bacterium]|nr:hypothetical protein [Veillonellaceae bacterium]